MGAATLHILVADDQREVLEAARLLLTGHDFQVSTAASPSEALSAASAGQYDAALIDLNYGQGITSGDQGLELISRLVDQAPTLPVIVMTAWSSIELGLEAVRRGAKEIVEKPWDEARLVTLLRGHAELGRALRRVAELEHENESLRGGPATDVADLPSLQTMKLLEVEGQLVRHAMARHQGNVSRAARTLGLSRSALYRRLERHKI
jgi:DNA-binding NtrC family response regulator